MPERTAAPLAAIDNHMLNRDGDDHRRLRRLVTKAFTPKVVEQLRPRIQAIADELLDAVEARGSMDLSAEYAFPLPITVIAELLGVPTTDQHRFEEWSNAMITPAIGPEALERFFGQMGEFVAYLTDLFAARRADPQDDLVSALLAARDESDALTEEEVFGTVVLLIVAGHETTVSLIGNAVVNLLSHQDQLELVRADPSLIPAAIEEVLRYEGPVERTLNRWAATDVELGGQTIRRGEIVIAILGSADRDSERFPDPDRLDVSARTRGIWPSDAAATTASAPRSRGSKRRSHSRRSSGGSRTSGWPWRRTSSSGARHPRSGVWRRSRSPGSAQTRLDDEREAVHLADDDLVPHARAGRAAGLPELAGHPHLPFGHAVGGDDRLPPDERLRAHHRPPPLRPAHEQRRLRELPGRAEPDHDPVPRLVEHEDRQRESDDEPHQASSAARVSQSAGSRA